GADAVVELPAFSSFLSGEKFAKASADIAKAIGADVFSFGSEEGDITKFFEINDIIQNPSDEFNTLFKYKMKEGKSYPRALSESFQELYKDQPYSDILSAPNNTLGLMYMKALKGSNIQPFTVKRTDGGYDSKECVGEYLSASGIREKLYNKKWDEIKNLLPDYVYQNLLNTDYTKFDDFSTLCLFKLRTMGADKIRDLYDVSEGLENRFVRLANSYDDLTSLLDAIKTKRYTLSRLRRIALYALFDITKEKVEKFENSPTYGRLLGIKSDKKELLSRLKKGGIVTCYKDLKDDVKWLWQEENNYADTHALLLNAKSYDKNTLFI
ncbi:MAG: nucleotidyltransferase family protein, partial [Clostridia bacterium]|nr:nucleotidyltransferase family protein [Clostridia bacterium]